MHTEWRCDGCGPVVPVHLPRRINAEVMASAVAEMARRGGTVPLWCPWPLPYGWTVTGVGWVADERSGVRAGVLAGGGPSPVTGGPADLLLVAETPGVGLASRYAGLGEPDPGRLLTEQMAAHPPPAKVRADGHPAPLWPLPSSEDRSAYAGEARGMWLVVVLWPAVAGYLLAEDLVLCDLTDRLPPDLVYGAPSTRLA